MSKPLIHNSSIDFLNDLKLNNNRDWFAENKDRFTVVKNDFKAFAQHVFNRMHEFDQLDKLKMFRIYRDVRFSKDKTPYNHHLSFSMSREGLYRRGGYFFRVKPEESCIACGFWGPESADLKLIRSHIASDSQPLRKILKDPTFKKMFGELDGEQVKTAPKGYKKDHPDIDLLRYKQFLAVRFLTDKQVNGKNLDNVLIETYQAVQPFFEYMTEILTHDLNGEALNQD